MSMLVGEVVDEVRPISVIPMGDTMAALVVAERLRRTGRSVEMGFSGNMKKRMARANKVNACFAVILGEEEAARAAVTVRNLDNSTQDEVPLAQLEEYLGRQS